MRYHIHPITGNAELCRAKIECPFGTAEEHYNTKKEARQAFEEQINNSIRTITKEPYPNKKRVMDILDKKIKSLFNDDLINFFIMAKKRISEVNTEEKMELLKATYKWMDDYYFCDSNSALSEASKQAMIATNILGVDTEYEDYIVKLLNKVSTNDSLNVDNNTSIFEDEVEEDDDYYGRSVLVNDEEFLMDCQIASNDLVYSFVNDDADFVWPAERQEVPGFLFLSNGSESNVYLHPKTGMVYKIPHENSYNIKGYTDEEIPDQLEDWNTMHQKRYAQLEHDKLAEINAEYCSTVFITSFTPKGLKIPIIAQTYLDPDCYIHIDGKLSESYKTKLDALPLNDIHEYNMFINIKTQRLVLFDNLLGVPVE